MAVPWSATYLRRCVSVIAHAAAPEGGSGSAGNASKRRSQRLNQQGRTKQSAPDLQRQLHAREARLLEQQRQRQQQEDELAARSAALDLQEQAVADLAEQLERGQGEDWAEEGPGSSAATAAATAAAGAGAGAARRASRPPIGSSASSSGAASNDVVEADYVLEQPQQGQQGQRQQQQQQAGQQRPQDMLQSEVSRQSEALLAIMQAGEQVEEAIAAHRGDIDTTMLQLLARRIKAAQQLEKQEEAVRGLELLYRRLKAEVDRQQAPPALRLLDELMSILDPDEGQFGLPAAQDEARRQAASRLRTAFSGGLAREADVLSLSARLSGSCGSQLADQLVADPVDPMAFMAQSTQLLQRVREQQGQIEAYLEQAAAQRGPEAEADRATLEAESLLQQRQAAAELVQQCLDVAQAVVQQLRQP